MASPMNNPARASPSVNLLTVPTLHVLSRPRGSSNALSLMPMTPASFNFDHGSRSPSSFRTSLSPKAFQATRSPTSFRASRSPTSLRASRYSNTQRPSRARSASVLEVSPSIPEQADLPLSKQQRLSTYGSLSPTFGGQRLSHSVALTSHYIKMNVNEKCDPARTPYFCKLTSMQRVYALEIDHWGRRGIREYVGTDALAGDKVRGEKANVSGATMGRKVDDSELNAEYDAFDVRVGSTVETTVAEAKQLFANASGTSFDPQKGIRAFVNEATSKSNVEVMTGLQQMFAHMGFFALAESVARRTLKVCQVKFQADHPKTLDCMHFLGIALQKQGLAADAEDFFRKAASGYTAAYILLNASARSAMLRSALESTVALSVSLAQQGKFREAVEEISHAKQEALVLGENDALLLRISSEMGMIFMHRGRLDEADALLTPLADRFTSICGAAHPDTLQYCSHRAALLAQLNKQDEAVILTKQTLATAQESLGDRHIDTLRLMRLLATITDSAELLQQLVVIWSKKYGADHMQHYAALMDMGTLHARNGNLSTARACFEKAYSGFQKMFGPYHRTTTLVCSKLGDSFIEETIPRDADAEWYVRAVLSSVESNFGVNNVETRKAANNVGVNLFRRFRCEESLEMFKKYILTWAQELSTLTATMDDVLCYLALHNYGHLLSHLNTSDQTVEEIRHTVWKGWARILGEEHPNTLMAMLHYGVCLRDLRKMADSECVLRSAWEARKMIFGEEHCETLEAEFHLAAALKISLCYAESKILHEHAYEGRLKLLGEHHTDTSSSEYYLCLWNMSRGELDEAEDLQKRCIAGYERSYGPQHYWTINSVNTLGNVYAQRDDYESNIAGVECFHKSLDALEKMFGTVHQESLRPLITLASLKRSMCLYTDAIDSWTLAMNRAQELYGPNAPKTVSIVCRLVETYSAAYMSEEAEEYYDWIVRGWECIRLLPADEIDPRDVRSLHMIREWAEKARTEPKSSNIAKIAATRMTNKAMRTVDGVMNYFRLY
eukprot:GEMP01005269.1.p1 GENE.GEMP01005269.1~~GEMP01005269.1.p1  ORF type:complete len:1013 (+),score=250.31 GEMP01005269.1:160-3198(+)